MSAKTPADLDPGTASDTSVVHSSQDNVVTDSKKHTERDISRLQGNAPAYSTSKTYNMGDLVTQGSITFRNITPITIPEGFSPPKWKDIDGPTVPAEIQSQAILGLIVDQLILVSEPIAWDQNEFFGDATKIIDEGNGIFRLHNATFALSSHVALDMDGGSVQTATLDWESSSAIPGPYTQIPNPDARTGSFSKGDASVTTQPKATAIVDAIAADVFVRIRLTGTDSNTVLRLSSGAGIVSSGTSAVANTPLTTKGDILTHDGASEQRLPVGADGQIIVTDSSESLGQKYIERGFELISDVTLAVASGIFDVIIPARTILHVKIMLHENTGNLNAEFNFNDDFGNNYAFRRTENMDYNAGASDEVNAGRVPLEPGSIGENVTVWLKIENQAGEETTFDANTTAVDSVGSAILPETQIIKGHWHNAAQVTKLNISTTQFTFSTNSRVLVYGSKD